MSDLAQHDQFIFDRALDYLRTVPDIRSGLTTVVRSAAATVGGDCASLFLVQHSTGTLEPYILVNVPPSYLKGCASIPLGTQCCGRAALHRVPWAVSDMWTDPLFADCADAARNSGMRSAISVPVMLDQDECVGSLAAQFRHVHEPCHEDVARLSMFARLVSMAILTDIQKQTIGPEEWVARELVVGPLAA